MPDTRRRLSDAELERAVAQAVVFQAWVNVYKAISGGRATEAEKVTVPCILSRRKQVGLA